MNGHYFVQAIFAFMGAIALFAALFNWDWFFTSRNARLLVPITNRLRARLFYGFLGVVLMGMAMFFFVSTRQEMLKMAVN